MRTANRQIASLVERDLGAFWRSLDLSKPEAARDQALRFAPTLVAQYGDAAATVAADWYDDLRSKAPGAARRPRFAAVMAAAVAAERVEASVRYAAGHLFTDAPDAMRDVLSGSVQRYALEPGRQTISLSARRDPWQPRWARVPGGRSCAFCLMLASRGPVYASEASAGGMGDYHDHCSCTATPVWPNDELPEGYDPDALYADYQAARDEAGSGDPGAILSAMRQQLGVS